METISITSIVIFLVFVVALVIFSLYPAIWLTEKLSKKYLFIERHSRKVTILLSILLSTLATCYIFVF